MGKYQFKSPHLIAAALLCFICYAVRSSADSAADAVVANKIVTVEIRQFKFVPAVVKIAPGQVITWVNSDDEPHTVVANDKSFHSAPLDSGQSFNRMFSGNGEFDYYCSFHPHMTGKIMVVSPAGLPPP